MTNGTVGASECQMMSDFLPNILYLLVMFGVRMMVHKVLTDCVSKVYSSVHIVDVAAEVEGEHQGDHQDPLEAYSRIVCSHIPLVMYTFLSIGLCVFSEVHFWLFQIEQGSPISHIIACTFLRGMDLFPWARFASMVFSFRSVMRAELPRHEDLREFIQQAIRPSLDRILKIVWLLATTALPSSILYVFVQAVCIWPYLVCLLPLFFVFFIVHMAWPFLSHWKTFSLFFCLFMLSGMLSFAGMWIFGFIDGYPKENDWAKVLSMSLLNRGSFISSLQKELESGVFFLRLL